MSHTAALIVPDHEITSSCRRINVRRLDVLKFIRAVAAFEPGRSMLWAEWVVMARAPGDPACRFFDLLRNNGVRVEEVQPKPIARYENRTDANSCDFAVISAIHRATKKADVIVLAANDGHFARAVDEARFDAGCRVELICDRAGVSKALAADRVYHLEDLVRKLDIERDDDAGDAA